MQTKAWMFGGPNAISEQVETTFTYAYNPLYLIHHLYEDDGFSDIMNYMIGNIPVEKYDGRHNIPLSEIPLETIKEVDEAIAYFRTGLAFMALKNRIMTSWQETIVKIIPKLDNSASKYTHGELIAVCKLVEFYKEDMFLETITSEDHFTTGYDDRLVRKEFAWDQPLEHFANVKILRRADKKNKCVVIAQDDKSRVIKIEISNGSAVWLTAMANKGTTFSFSGRYRLQTLLESGKRLAVINERGIQGLEIN